MATAVKQSKAEHASRQRCANRVIKFSSSVISFSVGHPLRRYLLLQTEVAVSIPLALPCANTLESSVFTGGVISKLERGRLKSGSAEPDFTPCWVAVGRAGTLSD